MLQYLVIGGACIQLAGCIGYLTDTLKGRNQPNLVSWALWSIAPLIGSAAAFSSGVTWAALPTFMSGFAPSLVVIAALITKHGKWKLRRFDYLCGLFSILALLLWGITNNPLIAIAFAIISDGLAAIPTIRKGWTHPESESLNVYVADFFANGTAFFAMTGLTFSQAAFPIYIIFVDLSMFIGLMRPRLGFSSTGKGKN